MSFYQLKHAIGIFSNRQKVEQALDELESTDFPMSKIAVIAKADNSDEYLESNTKSNTRSKLLTRGQWAFAGMVTGGAAGGFLSTIAGLLILLVPGVGPALAIESILVAFLRGGIVATVSGLVGALQGWFIPTEQAQFYGDRFDQGDYLVVIEATEAQIRIAEPILKRWGVRSWQIYDAS